MILRRNFPSIIEDKIMKANTKAKVTACLLTMMAPTMVTHANAGIQHTDWSMMRDAVEKPKVVTSVSLGKKIAVEVVKADGTKLVADSLTEVLRLLGYSRDEMWGKQDKLAWAWYRINNAKFKRGELVELEGNLFLKSLI
jgi:hypothetical protein